MKLPDRLRKPWVLFPRGSTDLAKGVNGDMFSKRHPIHDTVDLDLAVTHPIIKMKLTC
jgi:hypothetical protein